MALTGMLAFTGGALEIGGDYFTATWTIELEPHNAFAQVTLADFWETDDDSTAQVCITKLAHRKSSGKDEIIHFISNIFGSDTADLTRIAGDSKMSSITIGMGASNTYAMWMLQIFNFD